MKKIKYILWIFLFCYGFSYGQFNKESREKIKTLKIAYITEQLNLTPKEAEKFWPIYNAFEEKHFELKLKNRMEMRNALKDKNNIESLTEKQAANLVAKKLKNDKAIYETEKDFIEKISKIISSKKVIKLQVAEMEFSRKLMRKYRKKREDRR